MNVDEIIRQLNTNGKIEPIPDGHHILRREEDYSENILPHYPVRPYGKIDNAADTNTFSSVEDFLWIHDGDSVEFPTEIDHSIEQGVTTEGTDFLAWYHSFHWDPPEKWGIYILDKGVYYLAKVIFSNVMQRSRHNRPFNMLDFLKQSFKLLFYHEFFHFITDMAATTMEAVTAFQVSYYTNYTSNVYMSPDIESKDEPLEEALANAFAYANRYLGRGVYRQIGSFMRNQPNGYSAFGNYLGRDRFSLGRRELGDVIAQVYKPLDQNHPSLDFPKSVDDHPPLQNNASFEGFLIPLEILFDYTSRDVKISDVPIYLVVTIKDPKFKIGFIQQTIEKNEFHESDKFKRELKRLDKNVQDEYYNVKKELENGNYSRGHWFEKIRGFDRTFSIRLNKKYRFSLTPQNDTGAGKWICCRIGIHDDIYRKPHCEGLR